jgi:arsenate reductase
VKKIYYLSTCSTCKSILSALEIPSTFILNDIKTKPLTEKDLEALKELSGSYEAVFSKRAQLYKERDLRSKNLKEVDYKNLLLEHYTFLKRPIIIMDQALFIGNAKATIEAAKKRMHE